MQGYLKLVNDRGYTQCWGSNVTYFVGRPEREYCLSQQYSALCTHDPFFYQACGAVNATACENQYVFDKDYSLCGYHICQYPSSVPGKNVYLSGRSIEYHYDCNGKINCFNPENLGIDEKICEKLEDPYICNWSKKRIAKEKKCDGIVDCLADSADDEYGCGHTYGMDCNNYNYPYNYRWQPPRYICIPAENKSYFRCKDDIDVNKTLCEDQKIGWCRWRPNYARIDEDIKIANRTLTRNHMCTLLEPGLAGPCIDGRDQLNCSSGAALTCNVNHYGPSTITKLGLCTGFEICDDGLDEICEIPEFGCKTHKHTFCDGVKDCPFGSDEGRQCEFLVSNKTSCVRKVNYGTKVSKQIPMDWLCDGFEDCEDGIDEERSHWTVCGSPSTRERCIEKGMTCQEMYRCDITDSTKFIELQHLCDSVLSCENEQDVCTESREFSKSFTKVIQLHGIKRILQCLPGLENLQKISGTCKVSEVAQLVPAFGIDQLRVETPSSLSSNTFCKHAFGELYVYLTCLGLCPGLSCILKPISPKSCLTGLSHKVFTLSKDKKSLILVKKDGNSKTKYSHQEMFPCDNGNCVPYEKVCNLANDCGDDSDELDCANHFRCGSGEFVPLSSQADGNVDCRDQSDECDSDSNVHIISQSYLEASSWIIGITATLTNSFIFAKQLRAAFNSATTIALFNAVFVCFIALGDFLVGLYLLLLSIANQIKKDSYCKERFEWLTSSSCSFLGVISTLGSLLSLYSMTLLSVVRAYNLTKLSVPRSPTTTEKLRIFFTFFTIMIVALLVSCIPLMPVFEDYFINGIYYGTEIPLFTGSPDMKKHEHIIEAYYFTKLRDKSSWERIRRLIAGMFTNDQAPIGGRDLGFYGNDGVCLFKYFVRDTDPQKRFSAVILITNSVCFFTVLVSYGLVTAVARSLSSASNATRSNSKLQRKITIIIGTDFICWTPFAIVSLLNYVELIDATPYYAFFSTIVLPMNSMINPLIYDRVITRNITKLFRRSKVKIRTLIHIPSRFQSQAQCNTDEIVEQGIQLRTLFKIKTQSSFALNSPSQVSQM